MVYPHGRLLEPRMMGGSVMQNAQIMQISGHKNVQSVNTYSRLNQNQQKSISKVLSDTEGKVVFDKGKPFNRRKMD
jgi:chemotaxis receptor (MCP) glutamine deamidase CheD